jgi:Immunoglobulin I-set domain
MYWRPSALSVMVRWHTRRRLHSRERNRLPMITIHFRAMALLTFFVTGFQFSVFNSMAKGGTWTLRTPAAARPPAGLAALAYDSARGVTVYFYGSETWEWDGNNWAKRNPANSPGPRNYHAMAYDSARGVTVLFGGNTAGGVSNDTWEWNGTNWIQKMSATSPPARESAAMAYDAARGVCVLFGGNANGSHVAAETWVWDGTNWSKKTALSSPSSRESPAMAFDSARGVAMLFGGYTTGPIGDTWVWDGTSWSEKYPASFPSARFSHGMAFDSGRGVTVLFGGYGGNVFGDTWQWDGSNWSLAAPAASPSARSNFGMAFDSARAVTVLFGGETNLGTLSAETWEWNCPEASITQQPSDQSVAAGQAAMFSVTVGGTGPFTYHWRKNAAPLTDGGDIAGSSTTLLTISPAAATDEGTYDCVVTATCQELISNKAVLFVDPCKAVVGATGDCNGNGVLDSCEIAANSALDADNNGILDSCEGAGDTGQTAEGAGAAAQAAPCGLCGGGAAMMMPLSMIALGLRARRVRGCRPIRAAEA